MHKEKDRSLETKETIDLTGSLKWLLITAYQGGRDTRLNTVTPKEPRNQPKSKLHHV